MGMPRSWNAPITLLLSICVKNIFLARQGWVVFVPSERKKWHEITRELSGDHNNLSHFIRAAMLLVENAHEQLKRLAPDIQRFKKPATTDAIGITLYEQRLAQYLYDAMKATGRPKD